jgi:hypothetical protein
MGKGTCKQADNNNGGGGDSNATAVRYAGTAAGSGLVQAGRGGAAALFQAPAPSGRLRHVGEQQP